MRAPLVLDVQLFGMFQAVCNLPKVEDGVFGVAWAGRFVVALSGYHPKKTAPQSMLWG